MSGAGLIALMVGSVPAALGTAVLLALRRRFVVVTVQGTSMCPALRPGDRVLVRRGRRQVCVGAVVMVRSPYDASAWQSLRPAPPAGQWVLKRVAALAGERVPEVVGAAAGGWAVVPDRAVVVLSDDAGGTDSRHWGFIPFDDIFGLVIRNYAGQRDTAP